MDPFLKQLKASYYLITLTEVKSVILYYARITLTVYMFVASVTVSFQKVAETNRHLV